LDRFIRLDIRSGVRRFWGSRKPRFVVL
jgi:hypothetical protein